MKLQVLIKQVNASGCLQSEHCGPGLTEYTERNN